MMEPTKQDAEAMLNEAGGIQLAVRASTPKEYMVFLAGGLLLALLSPIRDLGDDSVVGGILQWIFMGGYVALLVTQLRMYRQVKVKERTTIRLAMAFGAWIVATTQFLPGLIDGTIAFPYTVGGVLAAAPLLLWAERLRRNA